MSEVSNDMIFVPTSKAAYRRIGDEVVIVNTQNNTLLTLNETGSRIWTILDGRSVAQVAASLSEEYEIALEVAVEDTIDFINELSLRGLIDQKND